MNSAADIFTMITGGKPQVYRVRNESVSVNNASILNPAHLKRMTTFYLKQSYFKQVIYCIVLDIYNCFQMHQSHH